MGILTLLAGLLLPWLGGILWLVFFESWLFRRHRPNWLRQAGYGFFLGYAVLTICILAADRLTSGVSWHWMMIALLVFAGSGGIAALLLGRPVDPIGLAAVSGHQQSGGRPLDRALKILVTILLGWIFIHLAFVVLEILMRPVFPWDAWQTWMYRAKVWSLTGGLAEFIGPAQWASAEIPNAYTMSAWSYPPLPSVIPFWAALSLGQWSETLVNLPVLLAGIAIGLSLYGQCREHGLGLLASLLSCYLLFSIPLFGTHLALGGYADIWMAGFTGLGFMALIRGATVRSGYLATLGLLMVALSLLVKNEGAVWLLAALLMQVLLIGRLGITTIASLLVAGGLAFAYLQGLTSVEIPLLGVLGVVDGQLAIPFIGHFTLEYHDVWLAYWNSLFAMGSWNLAWLLMVLTVFVSLQSPFRPSLYPERRAGLTFILIVIATQAFIFGFTDKGIWADTYTAVNRLPLHFIPALLFASVVILWTRVNPGDSPTDYAAVRSAMNRRQLTAAGLMSGIIVITFLVAWLSRDLPESGGETLEFAAMDFQFKMGSGLPQGGRMIVENYQDGYAVLSSGHMDVSADTHKHLEYDWDPLCSQKPPSFFWRGSDNPSNLSQMRLRETGRQSLDLMRHPGWQGEVSEIGFLFEEDGGEASSLGPAKLLPDTLGTRLLMVWDSWAYFEHWSQRSINRLHGGRLEQDFPLPVLVMVWLVIAVLFLALIFRLAGKTRFSQFLVGSGMLFLIGWMLLDVRWTANNLRQMSRSIETNWQADEQQRLLHELDCADVPFVTRIRDEILGEKPVRILLLGAPDKMKYFLLRAKYHLAPHNVHMARELGSPLTPDSLDYVIFMGPEGGIRELPGWDPLWQQALRRVDGGKRGSVYRVNTHND